MTRHDSIQAHPATHDALPAVVDVLSGAFFADRIFRWIVPDDEQRRRCAYLFYGLLVEAFWLHGEIRVAGMPAYLEASSPESRKLYERHGYVTMGELTVSDCPALYPMWRLPRG